MLQGVAEFVEEGFEVLVALLFLLEQVAQVGLELAHAGVEVDLLIAVAELDVLAGHEAPTFLLNLGEGGAVAIFGLVVVGLLVSHTLPVVEVLGDLGNLLLRELDVLLLEGLAPLSQVDEQDLVLTVAVTHHLAVLLHRACPLVVVEDPQGHADVGRVEHVARQDDDGLDQVVEQKLAADGQLGAVTTQGTIGKQETSSAVGREF